MSEHPPLSDSELTELTELGTATLYEAAGLECALAATIRPVYPGARAAGRAYPLLCHPADNLSLHLAVSQAPAGSVLVAEAGGHLAGYWGEVLARAATVRGLRGLVINGGVRDVDALERLEFPVFSAGVRITRTGKHMPGTQGRPTTVAGVPVEAGDVVVADTDGVVVLPAGRYEQVVAAGRDRVAKEAAMMALLEQGELTLDLLDLRARLSDGPTP